MTHQRSLMNTATSFDFRTEVLALANRMHEVSYRLSHADEAMHWL